MRTCFRLEPVQRAHAHPHSSMLPLNQAEVRQKLERTFLARFIVLLGDHRSEPGY